MSPLSPIGRYGVAVVLGKYRENAVLIRDNFSLVKLYADFFESYQSQIFLVIFRNIITTLGTASPFDKFTLNVFGVTSNIYALP